MIPALGQYCLILCGAIALLQVHPLLYRRAAICACALSISSLAALLWGFLVSDFTMIAVVEHSHSTQPWLQKAAGPFADTPGRALAALAALCAIGCYGAIRLREPRRNACLGIACAIIACYSILVLQPFERIYPPPFDGMLYAQGEKP